MPPPCLIENLIIRPPASVRPRISPCKEGTWADKSAVPPFSEPDPQGRGASLVGSLDFKPGARELKDAPQAPLRPLPCSLEDASSPNTIHAPSRKRRPGRTRASQ